MASKIILTEKPLSDLQELLDYIGADDTEAAARLADPSFLARLALATEDQDMTGYGFRSRRAASR